MSVRLLLVVELEAVLDGAEEPVRVGRGGRRRRARRSRRRRARASASSVFGERIVGSCTAVHELEQLHRELDVADAAAPRLSSRSPRPLRSVISSARSFIARISRTASGSSTSGHTHGVATAR